ncbi:hypothetical protein BXZ70DRAFT_69387 [Cristinia sonorae]|uniref:Uncharacterized protein n=1 Tax=Cristinia sonorae TaxID=1940300 RepID=A0A8K0XR02_9AGAR|nr:hypothetical protein BXZ70DRAFT_69387 [Cristinia sonorae]
MDALNTRIKTLRDRSVRWLVSTYHAINDPKIVKKAFEKCEVGGTGPNLSQESLPGPGAASLLRKIECNDIALWTAFQGRVLSLDVPHLAGENESVFTSDFEYTDDTAVSADQLVALVFQESSRVGLTARLLGG